MKLASPVAHRDFVASVRAIAPRIAARATAADQGEMTLAADIDDLRINGVLRAPLSAVAGGVGLCWHPSAVADGVDVLRLLGRANLAVARLFEGHVNAVKLVKLYGAPTTQARVAQAVRAGALMGVWGADGARPVTVRARGDRFVLDGAKRFASGLGLVSIAVLSAADADGASRLIVVPADDPARADTATWRVSGMRATASGDFDATGLALHHDALLGGPDDFHREPHFHGGVWRYAAAQLGGLEALVEAMRVDLAASGRLADPHQAARFARGAMACETARLWVREAAMTVEAPGASPDSATRSVLARLAVERAAIETMTEVDRALGAASYFTDHPVERLRRDLSFYLRQAAPDRALHVASEMLAARSGPVGDFWAAS
ncbi:acyl-CoA dehydrogenase family protein [Elioraea rosea]|uniref:acyl-CoA dehydrogenase family protein n=1 Tax=Elioraea rosea TaxID=2492390 RepID=UPI001183B451|nr:acyl-CoA dehydrogenase family protein [Elioraea rosea]